MIYRGKDGTAYVTEKELAKGGEGSIFEIEGRPDLVAKVFKEDRRTQEREKKILRMIQFKMTPEQLSQITWPEDILYNGTTFVGYTMPKLNKTTDLNNIYTDKSGHITLKHRLAVAYNLCACLEEVHKIGQVCGDLNPRNICVDLENFHVTMVDTDSYHIFDEDAIYRCEVGVADYIAPELQDKIADGENLRDCPLPTFTKETDLFALAVHIFVLLMNGCHPFACAVDKSFVQEIEGPNQYRSVTAPQPVENIRNGFFPFHQSAEGLTYPLYSPRFGYLPNKMKQLFIRTFEEGIKDPSKRVSIQEWKIALYSCAVGNSLVTCQTNPAHIYFGNNTTCPFCESLDRITGMLASYNNPNPQLASASESEPDAATLEKEVAATSPTGFFNKLFGKK